MNGNGERGGGSEERLRRRGGGWLPRGRVRRRRGESC